MNPAEAGTVGYGKPPVETRFGGPKANPANPGGKPVGARNAINTKFLNTLLKDFDEGGKEAIKRCREEDPSAYVRALLALQPKELEITKSPFSELTDEQLESIFAACGAILAAQHGSQGTGEQEVAEQAIGLPTVP